MEKILVIEDDGLLLKSIEIVLKKQGYLVFKATNGKEAVNALAERQYDLVLTDFILPYENGSELIGRMRRDPVHASTPVICISAVSIEKTVMEIFDAGADDYINKPFVAGELTSRIKRLLTRKTIIR